MSEEKKTCNNCHIKPACLQSEHMDIFDERCTDWQPITPEPEIYVGKDDEPVTKVPMEKCPCCNGTGVRPANTDLYGEVKP